MKRRLTLGSVALCAAVVVPLLSGAAAIELPHRNHTMTELRNAVREVAGDPALQLVEYVETDGSQIIDAGFKTSDAPFWMQVESQSLVAYSSKVQIFLGAVQGTSGQWLGAVAANKVGNSGNDDQSVTCDPSQRHSYRLTFSASNSRATVDGVSASKTQSYTSTVRNMYISSNGSFPSSMRIWHYSSSNGANYIPVKKGDGTYAMLDLATGTYPSITGTLTGGPIVRETNQLAKVQMDNCWGFLISRQLRSAIRTATGDNELELVEYVQTDGSQIIDTGFKTSDAPFWMQVESQSLVAYSSKVQIYLGAKEGSAGQWLGTAGTSRVGNGNVLDMDAITCNPMQRHSYRLTFSASDSLATVDGVSANIPHDYSTTTVKDMYISSNGSYPSSMRIWHYSSSNGANYIPVKKGDGTYAMLDLATGTYPSITGTLTGGPVVTNLFLQGTDEQYAAFTVDQITPPGLTIFVQ